ncbi:MAG: hypothetical protein ACRDKI_00990 [Solirubrobacterales bacterium]
MSEILDARAEVVKLARLLDCAPEELAYLEQVGSAGLRQFRAQLVELFYGSEDGGLQRFARVGNLLPSSVIASLTREAVGPVLAARVAGFVEPKQAAAVVERLSTSFVTDITVGLDPRRVEPVIGRMPKETIAAIAKELVKRDEYVRMGELMTFTDEHAVAAVFAQASDSQLLQIAFVAEDKDKLSAAIAQLDDERVGGTMRAAGREQLWPEALDLLLHLDDEQYFRVIDIASQQPPAVLDELVAIAQRDNLWEIVIPSISQATDPSKLVAALLRADASAIKDFADAVAADDAWEDMRELFGKLADGQRAALSKRITQNGRAELFSPVSELMTAV